MIMLCISGILGDVKYIKILSYMMSRIGVVWGDYEGMCWFYRLRVRGYGLEVTLTCRGEFV